MLLEIIDTPFTLTVFVPFSLSISLSLRQSSSWFSGVSNRLIRQGGHKPEKPGILTDFSEHGQLRELCATSGKNCNKVVSARQSDICIKQLLTG